MARVKTYKQITAEAKQKVTFAMVNRFRYLEKTMEGFTHFKAATRIAAEMGYSPNNVKRILTEAGVYTLRAYTSKTDKV